MAIKSMYLISFATEIILSKPYLRTITLHSSNVPRSTTLVIIKGESSQIKTGSLARSERVAKYNRLLRIEEEIGKKSEMSKLK